MSLQRASDNDEEVQCPLCLRYHNIYRKTASSEDDNNEPKPSVGEVVVGTVKVMGAASAVAMFLSRTDFLARLHNAESLRGSTRTYPDFAKVAMAGMLVTGLVTSVWSWIYKQKLRKQREEDFRGNLEICKECWSGIREVLLNGD